MVSCKPNTNHDAANLAAMKQIVTDSINQANLITQQKKTIDSLKRVAAKPTVTKTVVADGTATSPEVKSVSKSKKRMSNTTKGALIGVGVGAAAGAVSSKDKVKGAILGGVIGGAAGAGAGAVIDKKKNNN
jgi:YMGG-like Gly-zipper